MKIIKGIKQAIKKGKDSAKYLSPIGNIGIPINASTKNKDKDIVQHLGKLIASNITLKGTDNDYWITYNRYNKTTYVVCKSTMEIYFELEGKHPNIKFS